MILSRVSALTIQRFKLFYNKKISTITNIFWKAHTMDKSCKHLGNIGNTHKKSNGYNLKHKLCWKQNKKRKLLPGPLEVRRTSLLPTVEFEAPLLVAAAGLHAVAKAVTSRRSKWDTRQELIWPILKQEHWQLTTTADSFYVTTNSKVWSNTLFNGKNKRHKEFNSINITQPLSSVVTTQYKH